MANYRMTIRFLGAVSLQAVPSSKWSLETETGGGSSLERGIDND